MDPRCASCWGRKSLSARVHERVVGLLPISGPGRWAAGLLPVAASFVVLVGVAAPATGATSRSPTTAALADTSVLPEASPDPDAASTPGTAAESAPSPSAQESAPPPVESESNTDVQAPDTAQTGAVSPAIAHGHVADPDAIAPDPATGSAANAVGDADTAVESRRPAAATITRVTQSAAEKARDRSAPKGWRYRSTEKQYRPISQDKGETTEVFRPESSSNTPQIDSLIPRSICVRMSCQSAVGNPPDSAQGADRAALVAEIDPGHDELISQLVGQIGGDDSCGNRNISFRVSSPGDDGRVSQTAAPGECGRNTNVSIRINSPGDNGPVTQGVGNVSWLGRLSALVRASMQARVRLAQANPPPVRIDPAIFARQIERNARRMAWSLVAQARARANRELRQARGTMRPQAAPRGARERSRSSARVSAQGAAVTAVARANGAGARVSVSARVSIKTVQRTRSSRRKARPASLPAPASQLQRLSAGPQLRLPEARSASDNDSTRTAILIALIAAAIGSYLLVPPLRPARGLGPSRLRWPRRGAPPR
jgi:hypothetical protein